MSNNVFIADTDAYFHFRTANNSLGFHTNTLLLLDGRIPLAVDASELRACASAEYATPVCWNSSIALPEWSATSHDLVVDDTSAEFKAGAGYFIGVHRGSHATPAYVCATGTNTETDKLARVQRAAYAFYS